MAQGTILLSTHAGDGVAPLVSPLFSIACVSMKHYSLFKDVIESLPFCLFVVPGLTAA